MEEAVEEHCQPETYTVSKNFAIWVSIVGSRHPYVKLASPFYHQLADSGHSTSTITDLKSALNDVPQLLALNIARVFYFEVPSLGNYLLSREWSFCISPSGVCPPLLHRIDVCFVDLIFMVEGRHWIGEDERHCLFQGYCLMVSCGCVYERVGLSRVESRGRWIWRVWNRRCRKKNESWS